MSLFIKNIAIENFKSIRDQEISDCKRINVFLGYPNVGKSNILEALGLFSIYNPVVTEEEVKNISELSKINDICRVRKIYELFFNQNTQQKISVSLNQQFQLLISEEGPYLDCKFRTFSSIKTNKGKRQIFRLLLKFKIGNNFGIDFENDDENDDEEGNTLSSRAPLFHIKKYDYNEASPINKHWSSALHVPDGDNLLHVLQRNPDLRKELGELFKEYDLRFAIENASQSIRLLKEMNDDTIVIIPYYQIADTLRRLIFYKTAIFSNSESSLLFEEPEAHMFPPYISKFTSDVIYSNKNQYFISTHSPYVLNDFVENAKEELAVYVVGLKNGETKIKRLTESELIDVNQHGIDLFFNIESYLD